MRRDDGMFDYYAHAHSQATIDNNKSVWDWAQDYQTDLVAGHGIQTMKKHAEFADQINLSF